MNKKKILILVDWFLPGYKAGGPIKSIATIISNLSNHFEFYIITTNKDFGEKEPYQNIKSDCWIKKESDVSIFYASENSLKWHKILQLIKQTNCDLIYLNSFFSFYFSLCPLLFKKMRLIEQPVLLAPRGMLGNGALQLKKTKKNIFIYFTKFVGLHKRIYWHATSEQEKNEIFSLFKNVKIYTASNLQYKNETKENTALVKTSGNLKLLFLSRISEKKNLLFALEILLSIDSKNRNIELTIVGPIEDSNYWKLCMNKIAELRLKNINVNYIGAINSNEVVASIIPNHFLFLPTLNENYGHIIVESLMNGKPVIISNNTPWRNLETNKAGWDISLHDKEKFIRVILDCCNMNHLEYAKWSDAAVNYIENEIKTQDAINKNKEMFCQIIKNE